MINGNVNEFVDGLYYGDERIFLFRGEKYFIQGWTENNKNHLVLDKWDPPGDDYIWVGESERGAFCVEDFLNAKIFDDKTFWEVEQEIEWVDD